MVNYILYSYESTYNIFIISTNYTQIVKIVKPTYIGFRVKLIKNTQTTPVDEFQFLVLNIKLLKNLFLIPTGDAFSHDNMLLFILIMMYESDAIAHQIHPIVG
jgi:hypothetical protein